MDEREEAALAELLRKALHEEAARHVPAGDGLTLIRERAQARRRFGWARPVLVMGAVAAVAAAATVIPASLRHSGPDRTGNLAGSGGRAAASSLVAPTTTRPNTIAAETDAPDAAPNVTLPPSAGVADMRTVWPYGSRAQGYYYAARDVRSGQYPELFDAELTALSFVRRYVGDNIKLLPGPTARTGSQVSVVVSRLLNDGSVHAVTRVLLVPVSRQVKSPYVVAAAERPNLVGVADKDPQAANSLTASTPDQISTDSDGIRVSGLVGRLAAKGSPQIKVELLDAAGTPLTFNQTIATPTDQRTYSWSTRMNVNAGEVAQAVSIAAWTLDDNADVLELVALPAPVARFTASPPSAGSSPPTAIPSATR